MTTSSAHQLSVVVPIYGATAAIGTLIEEVLAQSGSTPEGRRLEIREVILVHDRGRADDDALRLAAEDPKVRLVWLSRNFGQHAATIAGIASTTGEWVATLDEDGQHNPADLGGMLDTAMREQADVVYAKPTNEPPHGALRNALSRAAKSVAARLAPKAPIRDFHSYRLVLGEVARSVAAYAGPSIYLDIALHWVANHTATCPVEMRSETRTSSYSLRSLVSHFMRMVLSSGTKPLRWVSGAGATFALLALVAALALIVGRLLDLWSYPGWTSTVVAILGSTGLILFGLGVVAEYVGVAVQMAMGKPLYLPVRDPKTGPLGRDG